MSIEGLGGASAPQERDDESLLEEVIPDDGALEAAVDADIVSPEGEVVGVTTARFSESLESKPAEVIWPPKFQSAPAAETVPPVARTEEAELVLDKPIATPETSNTSERPVSILERESRNRFERVRDFLSHGAKEMFSNLDDKAKKIAASAFESIIRTPFARVVSKAHIEWWSQPLIDYQSKQAEKLGEKFNSIDEEYSAHDRSIQALTASAERLAQIDPKAAEQVSQSIGEIRARQETLANRRSIIEGKLNLKNASIDSLVTERNGIAERMQQRYAEHLKPTNEQLEKLDDDKAELTHEINLREAELSNKERIAKELENERDMLMRTAQELGFFERGNINQAIKRIEAQAMSNRSEIAIAQNKIQIAQNRLNIKIAKVKEKAQPYKNREAEFRQITERNVTKTEAPSPPASERINIEIRNYDESTEFTNESVHGIGRLLESWNKHLSEHPDEKTKIMKIDADEFLRGTRGWSKDSPVEFDQFTKIIKSYYEREARRNKSVDLNVLDKAKETFTNESIRA